MLTELGTFGARARPFNTSLCENVLLIGLGQVGLQAIAGIDGMLAQALTPRERQEHTRLLAIAQERSIKQQQLLAREHRLLLNQDPLRWSEIPGHYAAQGVAKWWAKTPNNADLQADPTPTRPFGRLLLWTNVEVVSEKLYEVAEWLSLSSQRENVPRLIMILASLAEPEGSGMIFDVAGRLRALMLGMQQEATIAGIFTVDCDFQTDEARQRAMANVYATLKELDSICLQPEIYTHDLPMPNRTVPLPRSSPQPIFDHLCVTGDAAQPNPKPDAALTEFVMTWLLSLTQPAAMLTFLPPLTPRVDSQNRYNAYTCFGVAKLTLPVRAALEAHVVETAQAVLKSLLKDYDDPIDGWISKVLTRAHRDLYTQGLGDHHRLVDKVREWQRRLSVSSMKGRVVGGERSAKGWSELVKSEWERLLSENEPQEVDTDGVATPRDVLRRRVDDALSDNFRRLIADLEQLAPTLSFAEGYGFLWTRRVFEALVKQIEDAYTKTQTRIQPAWREVEALRESWFAAAESRHLSTLEKVGEELLNAMISWIAWQARAVYWQELLTTAQDLVDRLERAAQQIPHEIDHLRAAGEALRTALEAVADSKPTYPNGTLCTAAWLREGTRGIPAITDAPPRELLMTVFKRWNPNQLSPPRQLQRFPAEVLTATRLTLQPHSNFAAIHDFLLGRFDSPTLQHLLTQLKVAATPAWAVTTVTDRLDDAFVPPMMIEVVREAPRSLSIVPNTTRDLALRLAVPSPDIDEILSLRITHGWAAEHVQRLRHDYRRAYYRVSADNIPLHIDRRWETTMADLVHSNVRTEIANLWDRIVQDNQRGAHFALPTLKKLNDSLVTALDADPAQVQLYPEMTADIQLFFCPLQPFRLKIPPPTCAFVYILAQRGTTEVTEDLIRTVTRNVLEENFFFAVNIAGRNDMDRLLEPLRAQSYMPLELTEADIKHILSAPKPTFALRDIVINRINLTAISPFYTRAPVPDHMFFGREKEIADMRSELSTHSVALIGGRRIGKTSTLQKLNRALAHADGLLYPYYLDCSSVFTHKHFFRRIARDWGTKTENIDDPVEFDDVVSQLTERHRGKIPVFLLDEVDRLLKTDQGNDFHEPLFRTFRSLSNEKRCQFVFSGEKLLLGSINNAHSVLFNFPMQVKLAPLSKEVVRRLVSEPFEMLNIWLENVDYLIQRIYEISAGHPNIVQTICHALVKVIDEDKQANLLKREHLEKTLDIHQVQADIVETIWGQMHPLAKLVTLTWPENRRLMSLEDMIKLIQRAGLRTVLTQQVKDTVIPDLELYNFIEQVGQEYQLIPVHFPTILDSMTDKKMEIRAILESQAGDKLA